MLKALKWLNLGDNLLSGEPREEYIAWHDGRFLANDLSSAPVMQGFADFPWNVVHH